MPFTRRYCREVNGHFFETDHSKLHIIVAIKAGIQMIIGTILLWNTNALAPFQLATFFVPLGDQGGKLQDKIHGLTVSFSAMILCALFGSISYIYRYTMLPLAFLVSFITSMPFGGRWFFFGKILTTFMPVHTGFSPTSIWEPILWTIIGGACTIATSILPELCGAYEGIRMELYQSWDKLGRGISSLPFAQFAYDEWEIDNIHQQIPVNATKKIVAGFDVKRYKSSSYNDDTKNKIQTLVKSLDIIRCGFIYLLIQEKKASCDVVAQYQRAVGKLCIWIGESCQHSWLIHIPYFKRRMRSALDEVNEEASKVLSVLAEHELDVQVEMIKLIQSTLQEATETMEDPWQLGRMPNIFKDMAAIISLPTYSPNRALWIYCIRFSIVYTIATIPMFVGEGYQFTDYSHWGSMTVAIISMPGLGSTLQKIISRTGGSVIGLLISSLVMYLIQITLPNIGLAVIFFGLVTYGGVALYFANYGFAVIFITAYVGTSFAKNYDSIGTVTLWRFVFTMGGCILYFLSMLIWTPIEANMIGESLSKQARAVYAYTREVMKARDDNESSQTWEGQGYHFDSNETTFTLRAKATKARLATMDSIKDACLSSIWKGDYTIDPFLLGPSLCIELLVLVSVPGMLDMVGVEYNQQRRYISKTCCAKLLKFAGRLQGEQGNNDEDEGKIQETEIEEGGDGVDDTFFSLVIKRANKRLDDAGYNM